MIKSLAIASAALLLISGCSTQNPEPQEKDIQKRMASLGQQLFFDTSFSKNRTQSCATCHDPERAFTDSRGGAASLGDDGSSLGNRNTPTLSYAALSPEFHFDKESGEHVGGQFWDGRARDLAEQAVGPPLNPIEMALESKEELVERIEENPVYVSKFRELYGDGVFEDTEEAFAAFGKSIAAFEKSELFMPFDSKYDRYLRGEYELTMLEDLGRSLFFSNNNTNCASCHVLHREDSPREPFSNYEYHNIGTPVNAALMKITAAPGVDEGLESGKFKVPTLRNVAVTPPYMHNGVFASLKAVVHFYDKYNNKERTTNPDTGKPWGPPEVEEGVNLEELDAKKLSDRKVEALIAFMKLLTDRRYEHLLEER